MIGLIAFYLFSGVLIASAIAVIFARNPVHSVLWLILAFFNAAGLFLLAGAEFIAMVLIIVYVGAVAVLFLFIVMMLNIDFATLRSGFTRHLPLGRRGQRFRERGRSTCRNPTSSPSASFSTAAICCRS
jgi:NADH-quinone oxidoreductase subunit J